MFAIALTLLVVSLEVPATWTELKAAFVQVPVFLVCFGLLYYIWFCHYRFHRRYGLEDSMTIWLNAGLIFLVLFYVYPMKFLARALYTAVLHGNWWQLDAMGEPIPSPTPTDNLPYLLSIEGSDMAELMMVYSAGSLGIFLVLALSTWHAWRLRETLELDEVERLVTRGELREHLIMVGFAVASLLLVLTAHPALSGLIYMLTGPIMGVHGWRTGVGIEAADERAKG